MLKRYTKNIDFDLYRNAADRLGIAFVPIFGEDEPCGYFLANGRRVFIERNKLGVNNSISASIARDKPRSYLLLEKMRLPVPRSMLIGPDERTRSAAARAGDMKKPLVVKPVRGSLGKGVSVRLEQPRELIAAIRLARKSSAKVLIEEFIPGTNYRVTVFGNEVIDILERIPAYVTGDGRAPISALIESKNSARTRLHLKPIRIDRELRRCLAEQGLTLSDVPQQDAKIPLRLGCNMAAGGETRRLDLAREVHPANLEMFVAASKALGLALAGIDFISPDISKSHQDIRCVINEINRAPMLDAHYFADFAMNNVVGEKLLSKALRLEA